MIIVLLSLTIVVVVSSTDNNVINIHEELPPHSLLLPPSSSSTHLQWLPVSFPLQSYFELGNNQSLYTSNRRLDREEFCQKNLCQCDKCLLTLQFLETFSSKNISIRTISILIEDINDHAPNFKQSILKLSIAENVPIGYEIPLEAAIDDDYGLLSVQNYELHPLIQNPFRLVKTIGIINKPILKLVEALDRETKASYTLQLIAFDGGQPPLSGRQKIEISVTDINDNAPIFDHPIYRRSIPENEPIGSMLLQVHASDRDEGENARISYSLDSQQIDPISFPFRIDQQTGEITLRTSLDYEQIRSYTVSIIARDHGTPQLNNYATLMIDVTDVNDNIPNVLLTEINGSQIHVNNNDSRTLSTLPECTPKGTPLSYVYVTDYDSGDNGLVSCTLNDTRLVLVYLTTNAYSLQISGSPVFDYETEQHVAIELVCIDHGQPSLSTSLILHMAIEDCNEYAPEFVSPLPFNDSLLVSFETTQIPFLLTQFRVYDRDRFQPALFSYSFTVTPSLDLSLNTNGTLILCSMPLTTGTFLINVTVRDLGNLSNSMLVPVYIYSMNDTLMMRLNRRTNHVERTTLVLIVSFLAIVFIAAILIALCFLVAFLVRSRNKTTTRTSSTKTTSNNKSSCCCYSCFHIQRTSSCESMNGSSSMTSHGRIERAGSSQKTTIEVLDDAINASNRIYQYGVKQATDMRIDGNSGMHQGDFNYSEKVERYLTHLNHGMMGIDSSLSADEGMYGSSDLSSDPPMPKQQQSHIRPPSIVSLSLSQQQQSLHYQDSLKRFEQLYSLIEHRHPPVLDTSAFTSDSLYV